MPNKKLPTVPALQEIHPENESKWWTNPFSTNKWAVCVQLAQNNLGIAVHCPNFWLEMSWKFKPMDVILPPDPEWRGSALRAGGAAACQVTASCWYILLSSIMMWWPPLMKCMLSAGGLENKCSSAAREVAGLESGMNANQTFASAALSALAAVDSHPPEASPAVLMTPLSARSSSSFPLLFFPFAFSICS